MTSEAAKTQDAATRVVAVCDVISDIVSAGEEKFLANVQTQWAAQMGLIRIGEAVSKIPLPVRERFPAQPWRAIIDMRNFAAHQYDDLNQHRVWRTIVSDVPALRTYLIDTVIPGVDT
ncbi:MULTISPECIES: HepT-like ribonuclease domain-containing protein [Citricoccus]|uniref:DUF86 domain-containing protein n=1 Tax=Citricoccus muralis TaxID=169134 RepID=A0ABY8H5V3_9MICC|nr:MULTISPECIES: HepT-like ribonuclease domain-containing protein [Citricoccus]WBL19933.1 DUF86 domain-containing protein [Citricoccus sp. NR2]WFP16522.1 DUF86 domain-containing protein [Citricoccus muralis]